MRAWIGARPSSSPHLADMLCWGNAKDGQLGVAGETNPTFEPRRCNVFSGRGLRDVACGGVHSLFLLYDGSVYTCGSNSWGQLGRDKPGSAPGKHQPLHQVDKPCILPHLASQMEHWLILLNLSQVFSGGKDPMGSTWTSSIYMTFKRAGGIWPCHCRRVTTAQRSLMLCSASLPSQ